MIEMCTSIEASLEKYAKNVWVSEVDNESLVLTKSFAINGYICQILSIYIHTHLDHPSTQEHVLKPKKHGYMIAIDRIFGSL